MSGNADVGLVISGEPLLTPTVGLGVYTSRLIAGLLRHGGIDFRIVVDESLRGRLSELPEQRCIFIQSPRSPHPISRQLARAGRTVNVVERDYPHAIFHSPAPFWSTRRPAKTVVTLHDCIYRHFPRYLGALRWRKLLAVASERFAAASSLVLTDSEFSKADLVENAGIPATKLKVLYPWVNAHKVDTGAVEQYRSDKRLPERFWLYVGGYDYRKNVELLVAAYAQACCEVNCPPLVLAGTIPKRKTRPFSDPIGVAQRCGVRDKLVLLGRVAEGDMPLLYRAATLLVFPSLCEGFGLPPAEAIAVGTPVLVSDVSSLPEVVEPAHCRFVPTSKRALCEKLVYAADAPEAFRARMRSEFTEGYAISHYRELLRKI